MKFEFAKYTEITEHVFSREAGHAQSGYTRFFICPDVWDYHFIRVLPGFGENYEKNDNKIIVELNEVPMNSKGQPLTIDLLNSFIDEDDFSNYDYHVFEDIESVIESLDQGFGINNLKESFKNETV